MRNKRESQGEMTSLTFHVLTVTNLVLVAFYFVIVVFFSVLTFQNHLHPCSLNLQFGHQVSFPKEEGGREGCGERLLLKKGII